MNSFTFYCGFSLVVNISANIVIISFFLFIELYIILSSFCCTTLGFVMVMHLLSRSTFCICICIYCNVSPLKQFKSPNCFGTSRSRSKTKRWQRQSVQLFWQLGLKHEIYRLPYILLSLEVHFAYSFIF